MAALQQLGWHPGVVSRGYGGHTRSVQVLDAAGAVALAPCLRADRVIGALLDPDAQDMDVDAIHQGFLRGFRRAGGKLRTGGGVAGAERLADGWRLTLDELSEHLRAKSQKLSLLVLYMAKKASHYPIPKEEVFRELEPIAVYCRSLGYKKVVVAGYMGDIGCFGPYYAYDSDDDYDKAAESKVTMY